MERKSKLDYVPGNPAIAYIHTNLVGEDICDEIQRMLLPELDGNVRNLIISLSEVKYMSSAGVALLIKILTKVRVSGGELVLCNLTSTVQNLLDITKLSEVFKVANNITEAENAFHAKV